MTPTRSFFRAGFTLVEILVGIAVVGLLSSAGYVSVVNIRESAAENKLKADVSSLNKATQVYLASGGEIPESASVGLILEHLKMRAPDEVEARLVGMTGSFIDPRVHEAQVLEGASGLRAVWVWNKDPARQRFHLVESGEGFRFEFKDPVAPDSPDLEPERDGWRTVKLAASDMTSGNPVWIWDGVPNEPSPISTPPPLPGSGTSTFVAATPPTKGKLDPPTIDISGGTFSLMQLASLHEATAEGTFTIKVTNPNSPTISDLSSGSSVVISPGESGFTFSSTAISKFPAVWGNSDPAIQTYAITPLDPTVSLTNSGELTPFNLGVPRASGTSDQVTVTATVSNWNDIPAIFRTDANLGLVMAVGSNDLSGTGTARESVGATLSTGDFDQNLSLIVSAVLKSKNAALFNASTVATQTLTATKGALTVTATPASDTTLNASETIVLAPSDLASFPADYQIKYTTDGSAPGAGHGSVYGAPITPPADGGLELKAVALPPPAYANWFDSPVFEAVYTVLQQADPGDQTPVGALFAFTTIQESAVFTGNLMIAGPPDGQTMKNITFGGSATIKGNLYLPGHPEIYTGWVTAINDPWNDQRWHPGNEAKFANHILGQEYTEEGVKVVPPSDGWSPTPRVIDLPSPPNSNKPDNYHLMFQTNFKVEGKVFRNSKTMSFPEVTPPGAPDNKSNKTAKYDSWTLDPTNPNRLPTTVNSSEYANVELQTNARIVLNPGNYTELKGGNGGTFVLGDPDHPDEVQNYNFSKWDLSGGTDIEIVGKVKITIGSSVVFHDGAVIGNSDHPEWLELRLHTEHVPTESYQKPLFTSTGNSQFYGTVVAPNGKVTFENSSKFIGAVTAYKMEVKSTGTITLSLQPVTGESDS